MSIKWVTESETAREYSLRTQRTTELAFEIGILVRDHLLKGPHRRETVYEALNALAIHAATILAGTGQDPEATKFFIDALNSQQAFMARGGLGHDPGMAVPSAPASSNVAASMGPVVPGIIPPGQMPVGHSHDGPGSQSPRS